MAEFWWGSKYQNLDLYDLGETRKVCGRITFCMINCYCLVRPEGFYLGKEKKPFPDENWHLEIEWP